jgi:ProP effector
LNNVNTLRPRATARKADIDATVELLASRFPHCFAVFEQRRKPLKIGIHIEALSRLDGAITRQELSRALRHYCCNPWYLRAIQVGAERLDLNGNAAGAITESEAEHARKSLELTAMPRRKQAKTATAEIKPDKPRRLSLDDLRAAAQARKAASS